FFSSRRRHTRFSRDWSSDVCSSDLGFLAYLLWGAFPLYFVALKPAGAWEILAHRIVWSLVLCLLILAMTRRAGWVIDMFRDRRQIGRASCRERVEVSGRAMSFITKR